MRVLMTGHDGYIGAVAVPMFRDAGHDVVGLDTCLFADCRFGPQPALAGVGLVRRDLRDLRASDLAGFEAVVHLGGLSNDPLGDLDVELTYDINLGATRRLATLANEAGVERFLFSSSCSTYGAAGDDFLDESALFNPMTPYAISKVEAELALHQLASDEFSPTYLRNATAYGVSHRLRLDLVLNNLVAHALTSGRVLVMSDGTPWRPIVHIRDITAAFLAVLRAPRERVHDQAFNVGQTSENYRVSEIAAVVAETVPGARIEYDPNGGPDKRCYRVDCRKIAQVLPDFKPEWDLRRGARELYASFRDLGLTRADLDGAAYKRLAHIKQLMTQGRIDKSLRWVASGRT